MCWLKIPAHGCARNHVTPTQRSKDTAIVLSLSDYAITFGGVQRFVVRCEAIGGKLGLIRVNKSGRVGETVPASLGREGDHSPRAIRDKAQMLDYSLRSRL